MVSEPTDTGREAVERLAALLQRQHGNLTGGEKHELIATLRALLARAEAAEARIRELEAAMARKTFPILNGAPARVDWQLVADHAQQAMNNHYQTVERLAERGGLLWCELYAVLHNKRWEKIDTNEALIACRALEARYLAALTPPANLAERIIAAQSKIGGE